MNKNKTRQELVEEVFAKFPQVDDYTKVLYVDMPSADLVDNLLIQDPELAAAEAQMLKALVIALILEA